MLNVENKSDWRETEWIKNSIPQVRGNGNRFLKKSAIKLALS